MVNFEKLRECFRKYFCERYGYVYPSPSFQGDVGWEYAVVFGAEKHNGYIHYELMSERDGCYVDLHVEMPFRRVREWPMLKQSFECQVRTYSHSGRSRNYWRTRMPVTNEQELLADLDAIVEIVEGVFGKKKCDESTGEAANEQDAQTDAQEVVDLFHSDSDVGIHSCRVKDLLRQKLVIPSYQRGYCWERKQIEGLLESIWYFPWDSNEGNVARDNELHLGTVVLNGYADPVSNCPHYDVVDGQQRLITLAVLFLSVDGDEKERFPLLTSRVPSKGVLDHVYWAKKIIDEWIAAHPGDIGAKLGNIRVDAVVINGKDNLSLAYVFFNAINSAGKKLTDCDLLKPHHLRYQMDKNQKEYLAAEWDRFVQETVPSFWGQECSIADELLDCSLYRLRSWTRGRVISDEKHHVFEHFQAHQTLSDLTFTQRPDCFDYSVGIAGGMPFFMYVSQFASYYRQFVRTDAVLSLHGLARSNRALWNVIRAVLFAYFCKFGYAYLSEALMFVIERLGRIRRISPLRLKTILSDRTIAHTIEALDESTSPEYFFAYCVLPTNRYVRESDDDDCRSHVGPAFWDEAREIFKSLKLTSRISEKLNWCNNDR